MMFLVLALQVTLATPQPVVELDTGKLKGDISQLAWSPDGSEFYVQTIDRDRNVNLLGARHYVVTAASKNIKNVDQPPQWALKYWAWKSAQTAPGMTSFKISVDQKEETLRATSSPTGGAMAKGGTADPVQGTTFEDVANHANASQKQLVSTLKVNKDVIGTWINEGVIPGFNFTWSPASLHLLAFAKRDQKDGGPIMVMDSTGQKQDLAGPKNAILPAWSDDGKHLAWLERKDKKKFELMVADVTVQ